MNNAGHQLDSLASKLDHVDKNLLPDPIAIQQQHQQQQQLEPIGSNLEISPPMNIPVLELLESVSDVTTEYENLRSELKEMHHLNKEMSSNLKHQVRVMSETFQMLKKRIEAKNLQPHIQAEFAQSQRVLQRQRSQLSLPLPNSTLFHCHKK